jgi:hypothetical protein
VLVYPGIQLWLDGFPSRDLHVLPVFHFDTT